MERKNRREKCNYNLKNKSNEKFKKDIQIQLPADNVSGPKLNIYKVRKGSRSGPYVDLSVVSQLLVTEAGE